jgi:hypothetical protein
MPVSQFNNPILRPDGDLEVSGPFDPEGAELVGDVTIRFLLIQKAEADDDPPLIVDGVTSWTPGQGDWEQRISADRVPPGFRGGGTKVRGIGVAVLVRRIDPDDPPAVDTLTWCVTKEVQGSAAV